MSTKTETTGGGEEVKISANPDGFITKIFLWSNYENEYPHFVFLSTNKKVIGVWKSEEGSRKSIEKAEDIRLHLWNTPYIFLQPRNTTFIFTAVKYNFFKYTLYLISIFPYFISLYIINLVVSILLY